MIGFGGFNWTWRQLVQVGLQGVNWSPAKYLIIRAIGPGNEFINVEIQGNDGSTILRQTNQTGLAFVANRTFTSATILIKTVDQTYSFDYNEVDHPNQLIECKYQGAFVIFTSPYQFLTTKPAKRLISTSHPEFLSILKILEFSNAVLRANIQYEDGTSESHDLLDLDLDLDRVTVVDVSYARFNYQNLNPAKTISEIELDVFSPDLNENQVDKLIYIPKTFESDSINVFYYHNFYGGLDTLVCTGDKNQAQEYSSVKSNKFTGVDYSLQNPQHQHQNPDFNEVKTVNTGFKPKKEIESLSDLFTIKKAYEYRSESDQYIEITLETSGKEYPGDRQNLSSMTFSYSYAFNQRAIDRR